MRGTPLPHCPPQWVVRIIPAYAGNTVRQKRGHVGEWDHPRVCGEHPPYRSARTETLGSSPRMRGTHYDGDVVHACSGIIPAYAGNTSQPQAYSTRSRDHPRVCGEHYGRYSLPTASVGSSPRMRGTPAASALDLSHLGIIPAYAGNTLRD